MNLNIQNRYKNGIKDVKSDKFFYCKVRRAITKRNAIEKSPYCESTPKIISYFGVTNNIFVAYISIEFRERELTFMLINDGFNIMFEVTYFVHILTDLMIFRKKCRKD